MTKKQTYSSPECEMVLLTGDYAFCIIPGSANPKFNGFSPEVDWDA